MLTLNDGRSELWQWDTGRTLAVDADCSQVHFSNKVFGRSIDVDVVDGVAIIPDILLQTDNDLNVWAFVGTAENGYTKISKTFNVNRRNKPADYVFTPTDQITLKSIQSQIGDLSDLTTEAKENLVAAINEAAASGGGSSDAVLYTPQTLTDAQKKQARENIDAASSDFVINGTLNDDALTLDKTYAQIQEAVQAGKSAVLKVEVYGIDFVLPLIGKSSSGYLFTTAATVFPTVTIRFTAVVGASETVWHTEQVASYDSNGNLAQISMNRDPEQPMEIATKQYVDNNATCGTDMGITGATVGQIAKITAVDASGVPTAWAPVDMPSGGVASDFVINATLDDNNNCTADKTYAQIKEAVQAGKNAVMHLATPEGTNILPLAMDFGEAFAFAMTFGINAGVFSQYTVSVSNSDAVFVFTYGIGLDNTGKFQQVEMSSDPASAMEIATKQYVDASGVPSVTAADNGKFLRVVNGAWAAATINDANGVSF